MTGAAAVALVALSAVAAIAALTALAIRRRFVVVIVRGASMEPTLRDRDRVLVRRCRAAQLSPHAIVVYEEPQVLRAWVIKRLVARPGEPVPPTGFPALARTRDTVVPRGRIVVVGDNPTRSWDSRQLGYVASDRVRGVVVRSLLRIDTQRGDRRARTMS